MPRHRPNRTDNKSAKAGQCIVQRLDEAIFIDTKANRPILMVPERISVIDLTERESGVEGLSTLSSSGIQFVLL
jgi:hypothetical protein